MAENKFFMQKIMVIANWKCNPATLKEAARLFDAVEEKIKNIKNAQGIEVVICAPSVFLSCFKLGSPSGRAKIGAQDCFWENKGPYTGEVSPAMLKSVNCDYVILGHSKRRELFSETDEIINLKLKAAIAARLKPILCIGEKMEEREQAKDVIEQQLRNCLKDISKGQVANIIIVYEPVWAISTSDNREDCTPDEAFSSSLMIRKYLINLYDKYTANKIKIVYGGSVDSSDAVSYIKEAKMDGVLVGAASLKADEFGKIISSIAAISNF